MTWTHYWPLAAFIVIAVVLFVLWAFCSMAKRAGETMDEIGGPDN